jgi:undecaprenyl-diphosphatase
MVAFTILGSGWTAFLVVPLYAVRPARLFIRWLAVVWAVTAVLVYGLKALFRHPRPPGPPLWGAMPTDYSFPSGHGAGAFAFAAFVSVLALGDHQNRSQPRRWLVGAATTSIATCIAFSRVYLGVHYPIDAVGGAVLGGVVGAIGGILCRSP